jgi:hypothetical protein
MMVDEDGKRDVAAREVEAWGVEVKLVTTRVLG